MDTAGHRIDAGFAPASGLAAPRAVFARADLARSVAAVVVTFHTGPPLPRCLDRLERDPLISELIIIDNGNPPEVSADLAARAGASAKVTLIAGQGNVGFAKACNLGAARARSPYLAFINPDVLIEPGALDLMLDAAETARAPAIVGARLNWPNGAAQRGPRRDLITPWTALVAAFGLGRLERLIPAFRDPHREADPEPAEPTPYAAVSGGFMLMRALDFAMLNGFDEAYFMHVEDIDICRRAREAGGAVLYHPEAQALHFGATSKVSAMRLHACKGESLALYFRKFATTPRARVLATLVGGPVIALMLARGAWVTLKRAIRR